MYFDDLMAWRYRLSDKGFEPLQGKAIIVIHMVDAAGLQLVLDLVEDELRCKFEIVQEKDFFVSLFDFLSLIHI